MFEEKILLKVMVSGVSALVKVVLRNIVKPRCARQMLPYEIQAVRRSRTSIDSATILWRPLSHPRRPLSTVSATARDRSQATGDASPPSWHLSWRPSTTPLQTLGGTPFRVTRTLGTRRVGRNGGLVRKRFGRGLGASGKVWGGAQMIGDGWDSVVRYVFFCDINAWSPPVYLAKWDIGYAVPVVLDHVPCYLKSGPGRLIPFDPIESYHMHNSACVELLGGALALNHSDWSSVDQSERHGPHELNRHVSVQFADISSIGLEYIQYMPLRPEFLTTPMVDNFLCQTWSDVWETSFSQMLRT